MSAEGKRFAPSGLFQQLAAWNGPQTGGSGGDEHIKRTIAIEGVLCIQLCTHKIYVEVLTPEPQNDLIWNRFFTDVRLPLWLRW